MDSNRDLIYLQIEDEALKREREWGPAQTYVAELARVASIVNDLARKKLPDSIRSSYGD